jgi:glutamyl/glutaminyl-tRNA synthetase
VRNAVLEIGIGETDISFSWENLYAKNRDVVDPVANRYSFVPDPVLLEIEDAPCGFTVESLLHPGEPSRGVRKLSFDGSAYIPKADLDANCGSMIRLKDLFNIQLGEVVESHLDQIGLPDYPGRDFQRAINRWFCYGYADHLIMPRSQASLRKGRGRVMAHDVPVLIEPVRCSGGIGC